MRAQLLLIRFGRLPAEFSSNANESPAEETYTETPLDHQVLNTVVLGRTLASKMKTFAFVLKIPAVIGAVLYGTITFMYPLMPFLMRMPKIAKASFLPLHQNRWAEIASRYSQHLAMPVFVRPFAGLLSRG